MGDIMREDLLELDLNQEPVDSHTSILQLETFLNELETAHGEIEERIRLLEAVNLRARQREQIQAPRVPISITMSTPHNTEQTGVSSHQTTVEVEKIRKRDSSQLIAKALAMETDAKEVGSSSGGFFDCNICLDMAKDPIVTCCGHLFCWPCFYQVSDVHSNVKECPVCKGEVRHTSVIPIYGDGGSSNNGHPSEPALKVPRRPPAPRVESMRQQLFNLGSSSTRLEERIQQFNSMVGTLGIGTHLHNPDPMHISPENTNIGSTPYQTSQSLPASGMVAHQQHHSLQVSRFLLQGTNSISSLSSALDSAVVSAARLVQDIEAYIQTRRGRRSLQRSPRVDDIYSFSSVAAVIQPQVSMVPTTTSLLRSTGDVSTPALVFENQTSNTSIDSTDPSSLMRRSDVPSVPDAENGGSRRSRRRRLR